jgi:hypothetical protein
MKFFGTIENTVLRVNYISNIVRDDIEVSRWIDIGTVVSVKTYVNSRKIM